MPEAKETAGQIEYYSRAMKAPRIREAAARLADQARDNGWTHEESQTHTDRLTALDKTGKYGRITNVIVAQFSTREMAHFSTIVDSGG